jgi:Spy/CpxP family protein refolding chaperone
VDEVNVDAHDRHTRAAPTEARAAARRRRGTALRAGALALAAQLAFAGLARAEEPPPHGEGPRPGHHMGGPPPFEDVLERNTERLHLDDATRARIRAVAEAGRPEHDRLRNELETAHDEMRKLLGQDSPSEAAVLAQADKIGALDTALRKQRLHTMLEIRALLTPEQRQELVKIHGERKKRWGEHGPHGPGGPMPPHPPPAEGEAPPPAP